MTRHRARPAAVRHVFATAALILGLGASAADAQDRIRLGYGRLFVNDSLGELQDRWQSGSITASRVWGYQFDGTLPATPGDMIELRTHGRAIAPASLRAFDPDDRRYAGILSVGAHTHFQRGAAEVTLGADLVVTGPQTGVGQFQTALHDLISIRPPAPRILDEQIENGWHPTLVAEVGSTRPLGDHARLRPFAEVRWGDETLARAGVDLSFGQFGRDSLMVRDTVSGQRYEVIGVPENGFSLMLGADFAQVADSIYLPDDRGPELKADRQRLRAGLHWQGTGKSAFYGVTWLDEEFEGQDGGQVVGAARISFEF
ncbi:hypothetical protein ROJ8625_02408 [Roseivivax jejudonensis]|uniref:Lipid A deacylase LpxR family protein n=1 Tax=Roseivivax jejudonensis TaxID=1529041 RepID=A0A1X6ZE52_9RHOB|nr:lipid A-modifier LpxR family protein [Roseivivax jejudonensis]SLN49019.1 hypothetical protein ROJ8625_02408 [Roseivivax jejudonensis]